MVVARTRLETLQACKLLQCVRRRDLVQVEKLVTNGVPGLLDYNDPTAVSEPDRNERNSSTVPRDGQLDAAGQPGDTALTWAAGEDDIELVDFLLRLGADPDAGDLKGRTPVIRAAERGHVECVKRLLQSSANASASDLDGKGTSAKHSTLRVGLYLFRLTCMMQYFCRFFWSSKMYVIRAVG